MNNNDDLLKAFALHSKDKWEVINLEKIHGTSFYQQAISQEEYCLCWIARVNRINQKEMQSQHFTRENPFTSGLNLYRPELLLLTNGKRWFVSDRFSTEFTEVETKELQKMISEKLNTYLEYCKLNKQSSQKINALRASIRKLDRYSIITRDLFSGSGSTQNYTPDPFESYEKNGLEEYMKNLNKRSRESQNRQKLNACYKEINDQSIFLHNLFLEKVSPQQLEIILTKLKPFVYVNPWFRGKHLMFVESELEFYNQQEKPKFEKITFNILHEEGTVEPIQLNKETYKNELYPGVFRINRELIHILLKKKQKE